MAWPGSSPSSSSSTSYWIYLMTVAGGACTISRWPLLLFDSRCEAAELSCDCRLWRSASVASVDPDVALEIEALTSLSDRTGWPSTCAGGGLRGGGCCLKAGEELWEAR